MDPIRSLLLDRSNQSQRPGFFGRRVVAAHLKPRPVNQSQRPGFFGRNDGPDPSHPRQPNGNDNRTKGECGPKPAAGLLRPTYKNERIYASIAKACDRASSVDSQSRRSKASDWASSVDMQEPAVQSSCSYTALSSAFPKNHFALDTRCRDSMIPSPFAPPHVSPPCAYCASLSS